MALRVLTRRDIELESAEAVRALGGCDHVDAVAVDVAPGTTAIGFASAMLASPPRAARSARGAERARACPADLRGAARGVWCVLSACARITLVLDVLG
ncbi:hypothetical protein [Streptomyces sp. NPDC058045]|uniref:hypothetical protein n=1 Tax=Streptomyces sp. NPDC058045 TaxID=3346311 RepID=UPI0036E07760